MRASQSAAELADLEALQVLISASHHLSFSRRLTWACYHGDDGKDPERAKKSVQGPLTSRLGTSTLQILPPRNGQTSPKTSPDSRPSSLDERCCKVTLHGGYGYSKRNYSGYFCKQFTAISNGWLRECISLKCGCLQLEDNQKMLVRQLSLTFFSVFAQKLRASTKKWDLVP